jgi:hypothetical protein
MSRIVFALAVFLTILPLVACSGMLPSKYAPANPPKQSQRFQKAFNMNPK